MAEDPFAPLDGSSAKAKPAPAVWRAILPVPEGAPPAPGKHPKHGAPAHVWEYRDGASRLSFRVLRFDLPDGKIILPQSFCASSASSEQQWRWQAPPALRPLYGLDRLARAPSASVIVTEGEKDCDAAARMAADHVAVCSSNGSNSASKADWTALKGRIVYIWPDADDPGAKYALAVRKLALAAGATRVVTLAPPRGVKPGWGAADAESEGWDAADVGALIAAAEPLAQPAPGAGADERRPRTPDVLIALAQHFRFWVSTEGTAYAEIQQGARRRNVAIGSNAFKDQLTLRAFEATGGQLPSASAIDQAVRYYAARATNDGARCRAWNRVGRRAGKVYFDLCDPRGRVVEISAGGVEIIIGDGLPFVTSEMMQEQCEPDLVLEGERPIDELRRFVPTESEDDFILVVGWLVHALSGAGPYAILVLKAEQGSGKTAVASRLSDLIDPCIPKVFKMPEKIRDLVAIVQNRHGVICDNVSYIDAELSDVLCILAYGGGLLYRKLHTDSGVNIFAESRPIGITGIEDVTRRADLASRALFAGLRPLADADRRSDDELERDWDAARPRIFGALLYAVSSALRNAETRKATGAGRMAQFEAICAAAEPGLGFEPGTFAAAYRRNREHAEDVGFENDVIAVAVRDMLEAEGSERWSGSPTRLLEKLDGTVSEKVRNSREWPRNAVSLGRHHDRSQKTLRARGIDWKIGKKDGARVHTITRLKAPE